MPQTKSSTLRILNQYCGGVITWLLACSDIVDNQITVDRIDEVKSCMKHLNGNLTYLDKSVTYLDRN